MAWTWGDSFDLYATGADAFAGYWDSGSLGSGTLVAGRFAGSQAVSVPNATVSFVKSSGVNDSVHHIVVAYRQTAVLSGTTLGLYFQLSDGVTNQCCIVFRSDGVILLTSATPGGTVLATYSGAVTAANTWTAFEFEVIISNTVGRFRARKNGNTSDDFDSGAALNTRPGANSYANKLTMAMSVAVNAQQADDLLWRSDAASVPFVGDIRCYTRMPASDVQAQFSRNPMATVGAQTTAMGFTNGTARYTASLTVPCDCTIGTVVLPLSAGFTGNIKCAIFAAVSNAVLATATPLTNPVTGTNTFTFSSPASLAKGASFYVGFDTDTTTGAVAWYSNSVAGFTSATAYSAFPVASPSFVSSQNMPTCTVNYTPTSSSSLVNEAQQDGTTSYVYDATVGHADLYGIAALAATPVTVVAVTTRGFCQKSDAGTRNGAVQLKSGATTVQSTSTALSTSFGWLWRTDATDPATGAAWTPVAVNNINIGPVCTL
jgi:hypothetical protein